MRGAWWLLGGTCAMACIGGLGCHGDQTIQPPPKDSGVCMAYDFGIDETPDADADADADADVAEADADVTVDSTSDATIDSSTDSSIDGTIDDTIDDTIDATIDVTMDATIDSSFDDTAGADVASDTDVDATSDASADVTDVSDVDDADGDPDGDEATVIHDDAPKVCRTDVDYVLETACAFSDCHGQAPTGQAGLYITPTNDWTVNVIDVQSTERPDLVRIKPGDPKNSWLAHKIAGDQCLYTSLCVKGACGDQMPGTGQPLSATDLNTVLEWIRQGADTDPTCGAGK